MDEYQVNERAVVHAYHLIDRKRFVIGTDWDHDRPTLAQRQAFVARHSWNVYSWWHLGVDPNSLEHTIERYQFAIGDLTRVHRSALAGCLARAERGGHHQLAEASMELLRRLDARAGITMTSDVASAMPLAMTFETVTRSS